MDGFHCAASELKDVAGGSGHHDDGGQLLRVLLCWRRAEGEFAFWMQSPELLLGKC